ncbi:MAG: nucleotidyltransferase family protein [Candidatus Bathyarchaeota archaeon]|nr:MAG: nucleotidyltransferase family protein [Candidatus Bathyarchaeota archaeon]
MSEVKALVLCGGKGTRLRPITYYLQKTMMPIGPKQKPLLEYIVRLFRFHRITNITFLVNYKAEQIRSYFGDGANFGVKVNYVNDVPELSGTGGSVLNAYKQGAFRENDTILVYYGDILTNMKLDDLILFHKTKKATATVALSSGFEVRVGLADLEKQGRIRGFIEKPKLEKPVSIGILVFKGSSFDDLKKLSRTKGLLDLMGDVIPYLINKQEPIYGFISDAFWYDVGSIEAYEKLENTQVENALSFLFNKSKS